MPVTFAFDAKTWNTCVGRPITLTKVFRQKDQSMGTHPLLRSRLLIPIFFLGFIDMLNAMRLGQLDQATAVEFHALKRSVTYDDGIAPTEL